MNLDNIPFEVQEVWLYQGHVKYVGAEKYKQIQEVIDKYPDYFPWEHKYKTVPNSVHEAWGKESQELYYSFYPATKMLPGEGLVEYNKRISSSPYKGGLNKEAVNYIFIEKPAKEKEYKKQLKELWDKHYKIYGLKYRE